jgi:DNA recombination protein RmuC
MNDTQLLLFFILSLAGIAVALLLALLLRKQQFDTPADLDARMRLLEQNVQAVIQGSARVEASSQRVEQQIHGFTETVNAALVASRRELDEQLTRTIDEARSGRQELVNAFQGFETRLDQRVSGLETVLGQRLLDFQRTTTDILEVTRKAVDSQLDKAIEEARKGRTELLDSFTAFELKLEQRIAGFDSSLTTRFEALQLALSGRLEETGKALLAHLGQASTDASTARTEMAQSLANFREELTATLQRQAEETAKSREAVAESATAFELKVQERFESLTAVARSTLESLKQDVNNQLSTMSAAMKNQLEGNGNQLRNQFATLQDAVAQQLSSMATGMQQSAEQLRAALNERPRLFRTTMASAWKRCAARSTRSCTRRLSSDSATRSSW